MPEKCGKSNPAGGKFNTFFSFSLSILSIFPENFQRNTSYVNIRRSKIVFMHICEYYDFKVIYCVNIFQGRG